jgi:quinol monooxygenase YgiN
MVIAALSLTLEGRRRQQVVRSLRALSGPTLVEPGCIDCRVLEEVAEPARLHYLELWESSEQLEAHLRSKGYRQVLAAMEESIIPPQLKFLWVSEVKGMEFLEAARLDLVSDPPPAIPSSGHSNNPANSNGAVKAQGNSLEAS